MVAELLSFVEVISRSVLYLQSAFLRDAVAVSFEIFIFQGASHIFCAHTSSTVHALTRTSLSFCNESFPVNDIC
jgi:hypothetical protein